MEQNEVNIFLNCLTPESYVKHHEDNLFEIIESSNICIFESQKIPEFFSSLELWPVVSPYKCWACHQKFNTPPLFLPISFEEKDGKTIFGVRGNFCCFPCVKRYALDTIRDKEELWRIDKNINRLYRAMTNIEPVEAIIPSPCYTRLTEYGGDLSFEEFKNLCKDNNFSRFFEE